MHIHDSSSGFSKADWEALSGHLREIWMISEQIAVKIIWKFFTHAVDLITFQEIFNPHPRNLYASNLRDSFVCQHLIFIIYLIHICIHTRRSQRTFIASLLSRRRFGACGWSEKQSKKKVKQGEKHTSAAAERDIQVKQLNYRRKKNLSTYPARTDDAVEFAAAAATQPIQWACVGEALGSRLYLIFLLFFLHIQHFHTV